MYRFPIDSFIPSKSYEFRLNHCLESNFYENFFNHEKYKKRLKLEQWKFVFAEFDQ